MRPPRARRESRFPREATLEALGRLAANDLAAAASRLAALDDEPKDFFTRFIRLHALAEIWHRAGRPAEALAVLRQMWAIYPDAFAAVLFYQAWGLHLAGVCHEELGDPAAAVESYERLLALWMDADPDLPMLLDTRARLAKLRRERR